MVQDYVNQLYAPAAVSSRELAEDKLAPAARAGRPGRRGSAPRWPTVRVDHVEVHAGV